MNAFGQKFANQRTEDDIVSHAPIVVKFGTVDYSLPPLPILKNQAWRKKMASEMQAITGKINVPMDSMGGFMAGFMTMFFEFPDIVLGLVLAYDPTLPADTIRKEATDEQVVLAFSRVLAVAYPFFGMLGMMQEVAKAATSATTHQQ